MKTSHFWYVFFFVLGGIAMVAAQNMLFVKATAQQPPGELPLVPAPPAANVVERGVVIEQQPDGTLVQRTVEGKIMRTFTGRIAQPQAGNAAWQTQGGHTAYPMAQYAFLYQADPESAKLMNEEMQATQVAQKVLAELRSAESAADKEKLKTQLREKLLAIFDLQQKRRALEVTKIEERLAKLKDTMKKRDTAKDTIVDRRLDLLTGGVDELGWEETFPLGGAGANNAFQAPNFVPYGVPGPPPLDTVPERVPAIGVPPTTTVPRAGAVPNFPVPSAAPPAFTPAPPGALPPPAAPRTKAPPVTAALPASSGL